MKLVYKSCLLTALAALPGCDNGATSTSAPSAGPSPGATSDNGTAGNQNPQSQTGGPNTQPSIPAPAGGDYNGWCAKAGETTAATQELSQYYAKLCSNGQATALFSNTLMSGNYTYSGQGNPRIYNISPLASDSATKTTSIYFGVTIKLPMSIEDHFNLVGPKQGDKAAQTTLAVAQQATVNTLDISPFSSSDKYRVRGWKIHEALTKTIDGIIPLVTETYSHNDQFELNKGSHYMYTQVTDQGVKTIKEFSMLTAGVDIGGTGYLVTIVHVVSSNLGFASSAESQLSTTVNAVIKAMYDSAAKAKAGN